MHDLLPATFDLMLEFSRAQNVAAVHDVLLRYASKLGVSNVLAAIIPDHVVRPTDQGRYLVLGRWPTQWIERYFERQYVLRDPTIAHTLRSDAPLLWSELDLVASDPGRRIMEEAREFKLVDGITIPQMTLDGRRIAVSFSGERLDRSPTAATQLMVLSAYAVARALELHASSSQQARRLSVRERECLKWTSEGKTHLEIAMLLGVTVKAVDKFLANARQKLGATSTVQAVALAMRSGEL